MEKRAFTLIELLVVISIIAVMVSVLLPALGASRQSAIAVVCSSNLKQQGIAWESAMIDTDGRIPRTLGRVFIRGDRWWSDLLGDYLPEIKRPEGVVVCPQIQANYSDVHYSKIRNGYAVNLRWDLGSHAGANELQRWGMIKNPTVYPWIGDPFTYAHPTGIYARPTLGYTATVAGNYTVGWGLGLHHKGRGNALFADGHAASVGEHAFQKTTPEGVPEWFFNR